MKRAIICVFSLFVTMAVFAGESPRKIAFERGDAVWVANLDGTSAKKVAFGSLPNISPNGTLLAFNTDEPTGKTAGPVRHIAIADLATGRVRILKEIPSDNSFGPAWSPDGTKLSFSIMTNHEWHLGLINGDGSGFRLVENAQLKSEAFGSATWGRDGRSIFCHDLDNIYQIDLEGQVLNKWPLTKVLTGATMNSNSRLSLSADQKTLIMDVDLDAKHNRQNWDGPPPAIYALDLSTETSRLLTGKDDFVWDPCWLTNNEFLCVIQKANENEPAIYRMPVYSKNAKLIIKHARTPSVSGP